MRSRSTARPLQRFLTLAGLLLVTLAAVGAVLLARGGNSADGGQLRSSPSLAWPPPRLNHPITVTVTPSDHDLTLDPARDYRVVMPRKPLVVQGGLTIVGGHNVVLVGGAVEVPRQGPTAGIEARRGLMLHDQTGTVHIEGLLIGGAGLVEGIDLDQRKGAIVQLENVRVNGLHARDERNFTDNHPDVVQSWAGPAELRVDGLTGVTDYQGFFLNPGQFGPQAPTRVVDLRRVNIVGTRSARYLLWQASPFRKVVRDVWIAPAPGRGHGRAVWPAPRQWSGVRVGRPPGGDYVPAASVGTNYRPR